MGPCWPHEPCYQGSCTIKGFISKAVFLHAVNSLHPGSQVCVNGAINPGNCSRLMKRVPFREQTDSSLSSNCTTWLLHCNLKLVGKPNRWPRGGSVYICILSIKGILIFQRLHYFTTVLFAEWKLWYGWCDIVILEQPSETLNLNSLKCGQDNCYTGNKISTHCGPITPYGDIDLGQHCLRGWLVA